MANENLNEKFELTIVSRSLKFLRKKRGASTFVTRSVYFCNAGRLLSKTNKIIRIHYNKRSLSSKTKIYNAKFSILKKNSDASLARGLINRRDARRLILSTAKAGKRFQRSCKQRRDMHRLILSTA